MHGRSLGQALTAIAEDQWFDRKAARVSKQGIANLLVGMANAEGGVIVVGISNGVVEGTDGDPQHRSELQQVGLDLTEPAVRARSRVLACRRDDGTSDHLLVFQVEPSEVVHSNQRDEVFLRVGDENRKLSYRQRTELTFDKSQTTFDGTLARGASVETLDGPELQTYSELVGHPDPLRLLTARGLMTGRGLTVAAVLLFDSYPQRLFPEAFVRVIRYRGRERGVGRDLQLVTDERCEGPIAVILAAAIDEIRAQQPARRALGPEGRFRPAPLVPEEAWLEGLVNAVIHRSYSLGGDHIRVEIFDDRIEIESPGRFPGLIDPADPRHIARFARILASRVCARTCASVRSWGKGSAGCFRRWRMLASLIRSIARPREASA
jgi:ATP-dependent DNA helicase RecG